MSFRPLQLSNATLPIFFTVSGITMLVNPLQPENVLDAIVRVLGIVTDITDVLLYQPL